MGPEGGTAGGVPRAGVQYRPGGVRSDNAPVSASASAGLAPLFLQSMLIGLSIAAPVGQIGLLAIQRTLNEGPAAGLATGLGAALADAVYGAIGAFGVTGLMAWLIGLKTVLGTAGGLFLLWLAWQIWHRARRPPVRGLASRPAPATLLRHVSGTFVLTLSNPSTILSFMAVFSALAGAAAVASPWAMVLGVLVGSALWWCVLAWGVGRLRERFDERWQRRVNTASAVLLAALGLWQLAQLLR